MTARPLTAGAPLDFLVRRLNLSENGAGQLERRHGVILQNLSHRLNYKSGEGKVTIEQLCVGYKPRWVRQTMNELEQLGLITWRRGGVRAGKCVPSFVRVHKARLVELIRSSVPELVELRAARATARAARIAGLTTSFPHKRRSDHAAVTTAPTLIREVTGGAVAPSPVPMGTGEPPQSLRAELKRLRAGWRRHR